MQTEYILIFAMIFAALAYLARGVIHTAAEVYIVGGGRRADAARSAHMLQILTSIAPLFMQLLATPSPSRKRSYTPPHRVVHQWDESQIFDILEIVGLNPAADAPDCPGCGGPYDGMTLEQALQARNHPDAQAFTADHPDMFVFLRGGVADDPLAPDAKGGDDGTAPEPAELN